MFKSFREAAKRVQGQVDLLFASCKDQADKIRSVTWAFSHLYIIIPCCFKASIWRKEICSAPDLFRPHVTVLSFNRWILLIWYEDRNKRLKTWKEWENTELLKLWIIANCRSVGESSLDSWVIDQASQFVPALNCKRIKKTIKKVTGTTFL